MSKGIMHISNNGKHKGKGYKAPITAFQTAKCFFVLFVFKKVVKTIATCIILSNTCRTKVQGRVQE